MKNNENELELEFQHYSNLFLFAKVLNTFNPDMDDLSLALKSASTITDMIKKAANAADAIKNADLIDAIANLRLESAKLKSTLASAEERILEIKQENDALKAKIKALEESGINLNKPIFRDGFYYSDDGDGPFCTVCYDKDKKFIRVIPLPSIVVSSGMGKYQCQNCRAFY
jgi:regulator of replication initiation timing